MIGKGFLILIRSHYPWMDPRPAPRPPAARPRPARLPPARPCRKAIRDLPARVPPGSRVGCLPPALAEKIRDRNFGSYLILWSTGIP